MLSVMGAMKKNKRGRGPDQGLDEERKVESCTLMTHRRKKKGLAGRRGPFEAAEVGSLLGLAASPRTSLAQVHPAKAALIALPEDVHLKSYHPGTL